MRARENDLEGWASEKNCVWGAKVGLDFWRASWKKQWVGLETWRGANKVQLTRVGNDKVWVIGVHNPDSC